MFSVGSNVIYGSNGVCRIEQIRSECFSGEKKEYYILTPVDDPKTIIYVPTDAGALTAQMYRLLTREELCSLMSRQSEGELLEWINDPRERKEMFRHILQGGDRAQLLRMLRTIDERRLRQAEQGRKLYAADEEAFDRAQRRLHGEIAAVMHLRPEEVRAFVQSCWQADG